MGIFGPLIVAVIGAVVMGIYQATTGDNRVDQLEMVQIVAAGVGAFLVWITANGPVGQAWHYAKTIAYGVSAVLATLLIVLPGGLSVNEGWELVIAFATGVGVLVVNNSAPDHATATPEPTEN